MFNGKTTELNCAILNIALNYTPEANLLTKSWKMILLNESFYVPIYDPYKYGCILSKKYR